jgi:hypothetical protein
MNHTRIISVPDPAAFDAWLDNQGFHRSQRQMREPNMRVSVSGSLCDSSFQGKSFAVSGVWDLDLLRPKLEKRWTQDQQFLRQYSGPQARENNLAAPDVIQLLESRGSGRNQ